LAATVAWLRGRSDAAATQRAYTADLAAWLDYCADHRLDPLRAEDSDLTGWANYLATVPRPATGRVLAPASRARTLAAVSSWYGYLLDADLVARNPVVVSRPVLDRRREAPRGLAPETLAALLAAAADDAGPAATRNRVVVRLLAQVGLRVSEIVAADVEGYTRDGSGSGVLRLVSRTGSVSIQDVPSEVADVLDDYLAGRAGRVGLTRDRLTGPLLATATGRRLDQPAVFRLVRRLACAAGLPDANMLSPGALRP
jgi:site-specific recombinase XerD